MDEFDGYIQESDVPGEFREAGQSIDSFVQVNYATAQAMATPVNTTQTDIAYYKGRIADIIRNNPPLRSIPKYLRDEREDFLWYSDFYDEISKEDYHRYRTFAKPIHEITPANYAGELAKIDLPYFKELVDLVSLERLCMDYEEKMPKAASEIKPTGEEPPEEEQPDIKNTEPEISVKSKQVRKQLSSKRSYEPKLNNKQYELLAGCIEQIKLFRSRVKVTELKKLLKGKLTEPLQVINQKSLVYLFDQLKEYKYIKDTWISVADGNKDFISFRTEGNKQRYGDKEHYIPMQQFQNNLGKSRKEAVRGLIRIDETIEEMEEYRDK